jgi:hypothetical protein
LKGQKDQFSRCLAEKLLTYALGRGLEYFDRCAVDEILAAVDRDDYRFSTLLAEVVKSGPFQMRTAAAEASTDTAARRRTQPTAETRMTG